MPESWEWVRIKDIFFINPKNDLDDNIDVSFIPMQLISDEFTNGHKSEIRKWKDVKRGFTHFREGDVAVAKITPCFENRKSVILNNLENHFGAGTTELHILRPILEPLLVNYTLCLIKSEYFINHGVSHFSGAVGQQRVGRNILEETWFPLPPLLEQNRIVAEVERLFELINIIEESKISLEQIIKQTKSKILDLAIRGKLVTQDSEEESASMLLKKIRKDDKIKKGSSDKSHYLSDIPESWTVCYLSEICDFERGVTFPASAKHTLKRENNIACVRTANVQERLELDDLWYIDKSFLKNNQNKLLRKNDIIISTANSKELVGKTSFVDDINEEMCFGGFVTVIRTFINNKFLFYYLRNCFHQGVFSIKASQTTNIANINTTILGNLIIKIPPLAEQKRIVSQIEKIFAQLEIIEDSLKA